MAVDNKAFDRHFGAWGTLIAIKGRRGGVAAGELRGYDDLGVCLDMGDDCETFIPWSSIEMMWNGEPARCAQKAAEAVKERFAELKAAMIEIVDDEPKP